MDGLGVEGRVGSGRGQGACGLRAREVGNIRCVRLGLVSGYLEIYTTSDGYLRINKWINKQTDRQTDGFLRFPNHPNLRLDLNPLTPAPSFLNLLPKPPFHNIPCLRLISLPPHPYIHSSTHPSIHPSIHTHKYPSPQRHPASPPAIGSSDQ